MRRVYEIVAWIVVLMEIPPAVSLGWVLCQHGLLASWQEPVPWLLAAILIILNGIAILAHYTDQAWAVYVFGGLMYLAAICFQAPFWGAIPGAVSLAVLTGVGFLGLFWQLMRYIQRAHLRDNG